MTNAGAKVGTGTHLGELALRRHRAGEPLGNEAAAHVVTCAECRARGRLLDDEQRRFEQDISFDRFAAGVERAARGASGARASAPLPSAARRRLTLGGALRAWMAAPVFAVSAAAAVVLVAWPHDQGGRNRTKGGGSGAAVTIRVAAGTGGAQRTASMSAPEALAPGERMRIGYEAGAHRYVMALAIDDQGVVTPLYPESGRSVAVGAGEAAGAGGGGAVRYLPDSLELTGKGTERIVVVLSDRPLEVEAARRAARAAYARAKGDIMRLPELDLAGEQFHRTFLKP